LDNPIKSAIEALTREKNIREELKKSTKELGEADSAALEWDIQTFIALQKQHPSGSDQHKAFQVRIDGLQRKQKAIERKAKAEADLHDVYVGKLSGAIAHNERQLATGQSQVILPGGIN